MLSEKGSLKETPAVKLLLTVFEQGLTGILYIKREDILKVLYFNRGKMIWAISNSDVDKLENILVAKNLVNPDTMQQVKKQSRVSDSIGKLLVEKGLITLEELIDSTKEQLKRIIISVLKWKDGGFQFIKDAPPERLLSLDLDITQFIVDYIVEDVDLSDIWKEIGSLQVEFIKNPDEQKVARYRLSDKQLELLNGFDGEKKLEAILSRHSGGHRESLLKIIYFFLMAELLIKKEFELTDLSAFEEGKAFDYFDTGKEAKAAEKADKFIAPVQSPPPSPRTPPPPPETEEIVDFEEPFDTGDIPEEPEQFQPVESLNLMKPVITDEFAPAAAPAEPKKKKSSGENLIPHDYRDYSFQEENPAALKTKPASPPAHRFPEPQEEKTKKKFFNMTMVMVIISLIIGGVIFILLGLLKSGEEMKPLSDQTGQGQIRDITGRTGGKERSAAEALDSTAAPPGTGGSRESQTGATTEVTEPPISGQTKETGTGTPPKTGDPAGQTSNKGELPVKEEQKPPPKTTETTTGNIAGKSAKEYFLEQSFITAADVWKRELIKDGIKFSVLLEMDCMKESVSHAYDRIDNKKEFFLLLRQVGNRTCYLVMLGKYRTYEEATAGIKSVPNYFWQQKDPPEIVEISKYL